MTRKKYHYERYVLPAKYRYDSPEYKAADREADEEMDNWVKWTGGLETHNSDGSYTQELTDWLKINEKCIEIMGYGLVGEEINIWNPQVKSWTVNEYGKFRFSEAYWEYLLSEGYVKRWIECRQNQLAGEFGALSQSFTDEWLESRIKRTEIPIPSEYDPLEGLMSEHQIFNLQVKMGENHMREDRVTAGITRKGVRGL